MSDISALITNYSNRLSLKKYSLQTIDAYTDWVYRFLFYQKDSIYDLFDPELIGNFVKFLSTDCKYSNSSVCLAICAIRSFYKEIYHKNPKVYYRPNVHDNILSQVLSKDEIVTILNYVTGDDRLIISFLYGCGLRVRECLKLTIKDIILCTKSINIELEKPYNRIISCPDCLHNLINRQIEKAKIKLKDNLQLPRFKGSLYANRSTNTNPCLLKAIEYQYLFPATSLTQHQHSSYLYQNHRSISSLQKNLRNIINVNCFTKKINCRSFRISFIASLIKQGYDNQLICQIAGLKNKRSLKRFNSLLDLNKVKYYSPIENLSIYST